MDVLLGVYLTVSAGLIVVYYKRNRLTMELIEDIVKQNELLAEQNKLLRGVFKKYGLDIPD